MSATVSTRDAQQQETCSRQAQEQGPRGSGCEPGVCSPLHSGRGDTARGWQGRVGGGGAPHPPEDTVIFYYKPILVLLQV